MLADYISFLLNVVIVSPIFIYLYNRNIIFILLFISILVLASLNELVKLSLSNLTSNKKWTLRPDDATNCGIFNEGGNEGGKPAFPSGHMLITSFILVCYIFYFSKNKKLTKEKLLVFSLVLIGMGWSRINKSCHTLMQVVFGGLIGSSFGYLFFYKFVNHSR
jgi:membrane-associated phospholipid phosphatase